MNALCKTNKELPSDLTLGNLLFYSLSDILISDNELKHVFSKHNIPNRYIKPISTPDAFRRATSAAKETIIINDVNGLTSKAKIEVDEVKSDSNKIVRIVGRKKINEKNQEVDYEQIAQIVFNRAVNSVSTCVISSDITNTSQYENICTDIVSRYNEWTVYHTKDTIRNLVNKIVNDTHPIGLTPTGLCKFVPSSHTDLLRSLKDVVEELSNYSTEPTAVNYMEMIPVINTEEQQELIKNASTKEIKQELFDFTQELKEVLVHKPNLSSRTANSYLLKFKVLKEKVEDYEALLGNYLEFLTAQIKESIDLVEDNLETEDSKDDTTPVYV